MNIPGMREIQSVIWILNFVCTRRAEISMSNNLIEGAINQVCQMQEEPSAREERIRKDE